MVCGCRRIGGKGLRKGEEVGGERFGVVEEKRQLGERLMAQFVHDPESSRGQNGDIKMLAATQRSGTAADKVSAFSVLVRDNPIANLRSLDALLGMVASNVGKRHALTGFEALKELFSSSLLPDRKLKTLLQRPVNQIPDTKDGYSLLLLWYWEECLKQRICRYERFVVALEEASRDMLPILKNKALKHGNKTNVEDMDLSRFKMSISILGSFYHSPTPNRINLNTGNMKRALKDRDTIVLLDFDKGAGGQGN